MMSGSYKRRVLSVGLSGLLVLGSLCLQTPAAVANDNVDVQAIASRAVADSSDFWSRIKQDPVDGQYTSRRLFLYALGLCEAGEHLDRLPRLFELAERLQQRNPEKDGYGNFYWYSNRPEVKDRNAVDFCMEPATLIWLRHRDRLSQTARDRLRELMKYGIEGCLRHQVGPSYTNIALMNAGNLIRLGEALDRPDVADEGYERLRTFSLYTWHAGVHEYVSATYYRVDLSDLMLIERFAKRESGRQQARALLKLFWTDIALNWFGPAERLAGTNSRTYDYLHNSGGIGQAIDMWGWGEGSADDLHDLLLALGDWSPSPRIMQKRTRYPRTVSQSWGPQARQWRTHRLYRNITLSTSGAHYYAMDTPLTVDLPRADQVRGYFIPDGRNDPYGKKEYDIGSGHTKARHLRPTWAGAQRNNNALGVALYHLRHPQERDEVQTVKSHFVLPRDVQEVWLGDRRLKFDDASPARYPLQRGKPLVLRQGDAVVGIRFVLARKEDGSAASVVLVDDGQEYGAMRLTADHTASKRERVGAVGIWVRIAHDLHDREAFNQWRKQFAQAKVKKKVSQDSLSLAVPGEAGPTGVTIDQPWSNPKGIALTPAPEQAILALNGKSIGQDLLSDAPLFQKVKKDIAMPEPVRIPAGASQHIEAERAGMSAWTFQVEEDKAASQGQYVTTAIGGDAGALRYPLQIEEAGTYYIWGRVLAPTGTTDSFYVRALQDDRAVVSQGAWHTGRDEDWRWRRIKRRGHENPAQFNLPKGRVQLQLRGRENGTRIDRLFITSDPSAKPQ
jgi:hypothetical protein